MDEKFPKGIPEMRNPDYPEEEADDLTPEELEKV